MKKIIVVTGGAGFVGSNLIEYFIKNTKFKIISLDNYSSGTKKNHIKSNRILYLNGNTKNIFNILAGYTKKINSLFHFGEFARIHQSFKFYDECIDSNVVGTKNVFKFCLKNKIKLIYSATSATFGNRGEDKNLSPYSFTKSNNLELLENLKNWFGLRSEIIYFYNVYGNRQISTGKMATVIGIFETQFKNNQPLTVVEPGSQTRRFTHILDTIKVCFYAWKKDKCKHYSITNKKHYSIIQVAKLFRSQIKYLPPRLGERYKSEMSHKSGKNLIIKKFGKISLKDYISSFIKDQKKK